MLVILDAMMPIVTSLWSIILLPQCQRSDPEEAAENDITTNN